MRYSLGFKEWRVKKILPPNSRSIRDVALESGVSDQTLRNWLSKAKEGALGNKETIGSAGRSPREKLNLVIEARSRAIAENDKGKWLREKGLHTEHITQYEQELRDMVEDKNHNEKQERKRTGF